MGCGKWSQLLSLRKASSIVNSSRTHLLSTSFLPKMVLCTLDEGGLPFISTCLHVSRSSSDAQTLHEDFPASMVRILWHPCPSTAHSSNHLSVPSASIPECLLPFTEYDQHSLGAGTCARDVEMNKMSSCCRRQRQMSEQAVVYLGNWYPAKASLN